MLGCVKGADLVGAAIPKSPCGGGAVIEVVGGEVVGGEVVVEGSEESW